MHQKLRDLSTSAQVDIELKTLLSLSRLLWVNRALLVNAAIKLLTNYPSYQLSK